MINKLKFKKTEAFYAAREGCDMRTIRNWKRDGAPLDNPKALITWLATRKHIPAGTGARIQADRKANLAKMTPEPEGALQIGAAHALARLESAEADAYGYLAKALRSGDALEIKAAREHWLKVGDSLRRYELLIEENRRVTGQLIPRENIEDTIKRFTFWLRISGQKMANSMAVNISRIPHDQNLQSSIGEILRRGFVETFLSATVNVIAGAQKDEFPEWLRKAFVADVSDSHVGIDETLSVRVKTVEMFLDYSAEVIAARQANRDPKFTLSQLIQERFTPKNKNENS